MAVDQTTIGTVYIVDDNVAVRDAILWLVREVGLKAEAFATAQDFLVDYNANVVGCLVLDIRMPGMSGLDLQDKLASQRDSLPVIVVTGHGDVPMAVRSMKTGAFEFFQKPFNDQVLLDTVFDAIEHHRNILIEKNRKVEASVNLARLTRREYEVLSLLRAGESSKSIAAELNISVRTVEGHRAKIMDKMKAQTIAQLLETAHSAESA